MIICKPELFLFIGDDGVKIILLSDKNSNNLIKYGSNAEFTVFEFYQTAII